jgi:hypothetical protein
MSKIEYEEVEASDVESTYDTPYYNLDITDEVMDSIIEQPLDSSETSEAAPIEGEEVHDEVEASDAAGEELVEEQSEPEENKDVFEISGEQYSLKDIENWKTDSENRSEWQKSNTKKSQDVSTERKALQAEMDKWMALRDDSDLLDAVRDYLGDDADSHPLFMEPKEVSQSEESEPKAEPTELENRVVELETRLQVETDIQNLMKSHPELRDNEDAVKEVIDVMINRNLPSLEDAFIIATATATEKSAFIKAKKAIKDAQAAKKIPVQKGDTRAKRGNTIPKMRDYNDVREYALENYELVS